MAAASTCSQLRQQGQRVRTTSARADALAKESGNVTVPAGDSCVAARRSPPHQPPKEQNPQRAAGATWQQSCAKKGQCVRARPRRAGTRRPSPPPAGGRILGGRCRRRTWKSSVEEWKPSGKTTSRPGSRRQAPEIKLYPRPDAVFPVYEGWETSHGLHGHWYSQWEDYEGEAVDLLTLETRSSVRLARARSDGDRLPGRTGVQPLVQTPPRFEWPSQARTSSPRGRGAVRVADVAGERGVGAPDVDGVSRGRPGRRPVVLRPGHRMGQNESARRNSRPGT